MDKTNKEAEVFTAPEGAVLSEVLAMLGDLRKEVAELKAARDMKLPKDKGDKVKRADHPKPGGQGAINLYHAGDLAEAIRAGRLDEAAKIYNDWMYSEFGSRMTPEDWATLAGGDEALAMVQEHWAGKDWQGNINRTGELGFDVGATKMASPFSCARIGAISALEPD